MARNSLTATLGGALRGYPAVYVVHDRNVARYAEQIAALGARRGSAPYPCYALTADEAHKDMDTVLGICRWLLEQGADRKALVLAVGGGVTTDMAGLAACLYKRGVRYANVPTTLLAQVDAGIGGKTGVNLDGYKNILGVIRQPEFTCILPETLHTLPEREFRSGVAELLKTFLICDRQHYGQAIGFLKECGGRPDADDPRLAALIEAAAAIKSAIVEEDEQEQGRRRVLNFGHTFAHAIEWYQHTHACAAPLTHGEAVAVGMVQAARLGEGLGVTQPGLAAQLSEDFAACGLPVELPCPEEALRQAIRKDKKAEGAQVHYVLPVRIGKVIIKKL